MLDDAAPLKGIAPTWILETSRPEGRSNCQVGYRLADPIEDVGAATRLHRALADAGHITADKNGNNPVRYVRLPVGSNTKHDPPHPHRLLTWEPAARVTLDDLILGLGLDRDAILSPPHVTTAPIETPSSTEPAAEWLPKARRLAWNGARRTHDDPALGRHAEIYKLGSFAARDGLPESALDFILAEFAERMRPTNTNGEAAPINIEAERKTIADGYARGVADGRSAPPPPSGSESPRGENARNGPVGMDELRARDEEENASLLSCNSFDSFELLRHAGSTPSQPLRNPFAITPGELIENGEKGPRRMIDSAAADVVSRALTDRLAWDAEAGSWLLWVGTHWRPLVTAAPAEKLIADAVAVGTDPLGYRLGYLTGITGIACRRGLLPPPTWPTGVVPFENGLLDLKTRTLQPAAPDYALDWSLPHRFDPTAKCPNIKAWLSSAVENDEETVQLLRAWLAALVRGIFLEMFLVLIGRGGSGKGTFQRLAMALVGAVNVAISSLRDLEENRFETAKLYGKRLAMINEAGRHGGALNMLKAVTGGDSIPLERKHVQQSGSFVFNGLVLLATNEQIASTDATSGLERRRVMVRFPRTATPAEREDWRSRGGEQGVLHAEMPGLINWLLDMPVAEIRRRIEAPPERVAADNLLGMAAGNTVADWMMLSCIPGRPDKTADHDLYVTQIGEKKEVRESGSITFAHWHDRLYPNYLKWCDEQNRRPVSVVKFGTVLMDIAESLGYLLENGQHPRTRASCIYGLRLRLRSEDSNSWLEDSHDWVASVRQAAKGFEACEGVREGVEQAWRRSAKESKGFAQTLVSNAHSPEASVGIDRLREADEARF
ncbi:DUF5906 domain-containing protein [Thiocapsa sp. N5-Cardenillas]|uniref:DNA primase family protein n=1 Tax=Thiocapsa sp. N5-Cardenillas TaxID=3137397 RepID=UPI0035AE9308